MPSKRRAPKFEVLPTSLTLFNYYSQRLSNLALVNTTSVSRKLQSHTIDDREKDLSKQMNNLCHTLKKPIFFQKGGSFYQKTCILEEED